MAQHQIMDVDDEEDEHSMTPSDLSLRRSRSLRTFPDLPHPVGPHKSNPVSRASTPRPDPYGSEAFKRKANRILQLLGYYGEQIKETQDAQHLAYGSLSAGTQGHGRQLRKQAKERMAGKVFVREELTQI